jgi:hypothetical protein
VRSGCVVYIHHTSGMHVGQSGRIETGGDYHFGMLTRDRKPVYLWPHCIISRGTILHLLRGSLHNI